MKRHLIIFGSARSNGDTMIATTQIMKNLEDPLLIDLSKYAVSDFNYKNEYDEDDFLKIIHIALEYDILIFATPIYWYTMSASMKRFFDRITDLLSIHKDLGRKLRYKKWLLSVLMQPTQKAWMGLSLYLLIPRIILE